MKTDCRNAKLHFQMTFSLPSTSCLLKLPNDCDDDGYDDDDDCSVFETTKWHDFKKFRGFGCRNRENNRKDLKSSYCQKKGEGNDQAN